jgi:hypothetical protein
MAVTQTAFKTNRAGTWTFQTDATSTFTDAILVKAGDTVYWQIGSGLTGTFQLQSAPVGSATFAPTPFNGSLSVTDGNVSGVFETGGDCLFRIALTAFTSGSCTIQIRK